MTSRKQPARPMSANNPARPERSLPRAGRGGRRASFDPRPFGHFPQPLAEPGVQHPQQFQEEDDEDAFKQWLVHLEAGRLAK